MKRFDFEEDDEDGEEDEDIFGDGEKPMTPKEYRELLAEERALEQETVELEYLGLGNELMREAIRVCEKSFLWKFYGLQTRLNMISKAYTKLRNIRDN